jgi:uncharacterized protein (UPF0147 family)
MTQQLSPQQQSSRTANPVSLPPSPNEKLGWVRMGIAVSISGAIGAILLSLGIGGYMAVKAQAQKEYNNRQQMILDSAKAYQHSGNFDACLSEAMQVQPDATLFPDAQGLIRDCQQSLVSQQIEAASQLANRGELKNAIDLLMQVPNVSSNTQLQELVRQFSQRMHDIAWTYYRKETNKFNEAIAVLRAIPENSPIAPEVQSAAQQMQTEWLNNEQHFRAAQAALQKGDLAKARQEAELITSHAFWQQQLRPFLRALEYQEQEQFYAHVLQDAEAALERKEHRNAIEIAQQLPDQHPWAERKTNIIAKAKAEQRQLELCQRMFSWLIDCY